MMMFGRGRDERDDFSAPGGGFGGFGQLNPWQGQQAPPPPQADFGTQKEGIPFAPPARWQPDFGQMAQRMHRGPGQGMARRRFQGQGVM